MAANTSDPVTYDKALNLVSNQRISKFKDPKLEDYFIVSGENDDYLVIKSSFCTCEHFIIRCLKTPGMICYHILAVELAGEIKREVDMDWMELLLREH